MSITDLFADAANGKTVNPTRLFPRCHRKAHLDAYIDGKRKIVVLCCSTCDRPRIMITNGKIKEL